MRRLIVTLSAIGLLISSANAQSLGATQRLGTYSTDSKAPDSSHSTEDKKKEKAAAAKAYKDALHSVPEQKLSDPWAKMR
jgi:hypothetical protein